MKQIIRRIFTHNRPQPILKSKIFNQKYDCILNSFGNANKNKIIYIIKRNKGSGFFSNFFFVLNHINLANKFGFIPVVDMKNFKTIYNEKSGKFKEKNLWNLFFYNISNIKLNEAYRSKNVIFSSDIFPQITNFDDWEKNNLKNILKKNIKIKSPFINKQNEFIKNKFKGKILGLHFRGTSYKTARSHALQPDKKTMIKLLDIILKKNNYKKIFVVTEEKKYLESLKNYYKDKIIYLDKSYRSYKDDSFKIYPRKNHRYFLAEDILIETLILSCCDGIISNTTNVEKAARFLSKKKQKIHKIFLGLNSNNKYLARIKWYVKSILPKWLGGFAI